MTKWHRKSKRSLTGRRVRHSRKKKKFEKGNVFLETRIGKRSVKVQKTIGGNKKLKVLSVERINVADPKKGTIKSVKVESVEKNPANPHYVRRNVITKGAVVKTELGSARVTSKPGQHGIVNAVLAEEKK